MLTAMECTPATEHDYEIFDAIVPADHYLRRVKLTIDFPGFRDRLTSGYNPTLGRPAIEPLLMLKLEFLQFHYNLSDREVIKQTQVNMAYRFFLDLSLKSELPDPSLLSVSAREWAPKLISRSFRIWSPKRANMGWSRTACGSKTQPTSWPTSRSPRP